MATRVWSSGRIGDWTVSSNWSGGVVPSGGDTAIVGAGDAIIDGLTIEGEAIVLGGTASATSVTLTLDDAKLVASGSGSSLVHTVIDGISLAPL